MRQTTHHESTNLEGVATAIRHEPCSGRQPRFNSTQRIATLVKLMLAIAMIASVGMAFSQTTFAQTEEMSEMEMMERVATLQKKLGSQKVSERDAAQKELLEIGPVALDFIEPPNDETEADVRARLIQITSELEEKGAELATQNSKLTLSGEFTVTATLRKISELTKNDVALVDNVPVVTADKKIKVDFEDVVFWDAMKQVMELAEIEVDPYAGDPGQLRLGPVQPMVEIDPATGEQIVKKASKIEVPRAMSGVFDVQVTRVDSQRNLMRPQVNHSSVHLLVRWEPRIKPISIDLPMTDIEVIDEYDNKVAVTNEEAKLSGIVQPEIPEVEFPIRLKLVDRQVETLKSMTLKFNTVLPGRTETFRFRKLEDIEKGTQQRKAGAIVTFGGYEKNDDVYGLIIRLGFDEDNNALESHQSWVFQNELFLQDAAGKRIDFVGLETIQQDETQVGLRYYFVEDPGECTLFYKTPAAVVKVPVKVVLKKIPLP